MLGSLNPWKEEEEEGKALCLRRRKQNIPQKLFFPSAIHPTKKGDPKFTIFSTFLAASARTTTSNPPLKKVSNKLSPSNSPDSPFYRNKAPTLNLQYGAAGPRAGIWGKKKSLFYIPFLALLSPPVWLYPPTVQRPRGGSDASKSFLTPVGR